MPPNPAPTIRTSVSSSSAEFSLFDESVPIVLLISVLNWPIVWDEWKVVKVRKVFEENLVDNQAMSYDRNLLLKYTSEWATPAQHRRNLRGTSCCSISVACTNVVIDPFGQLHQRHLSFLVFRNDADSFDTLLTGSQRPT